MCCLSTKRRRAAMTAQTERVAEGGATSSGSTRRVARTLLLAAWVAVAGVAASGCGVLSDETESSWDGPVTACGIEVIAQPGFLVEEWRSAPHDELPDGVRLWVFLPVDDPSLNPPASLWDVVTISLSSPEIDEFARDFAEWSAGSTDGGAAPTAFGPSAFLDVDGCSAFFSATAAGASVPARSGDRWYLGLLVGDR